MGLKFVSAAKPANYADRLHEIQQQLRKLEKQVKALRTEEKHIARFLSKYTKGASFTYDAADGYVKIVRINDVERLILDQAKVLKLLRNRTPYAKSSWTTVKVDWRYEK